MFALAIGGLGLVAGPLLAFLAEAAPDNSGGGRDARTCRGCGHPRGALTRLALVGWAVRCSRCRSRPGRRELVITLVSGGVFGAVAAVAGARWHALPLLLFAAALIVLTVIDIERFRLPDRVIFPSLALSAVAITAISLGVGPSEHLVPAVAGSLTYFALLLLPNLVNPAGLAFGDVKLALLLGLVIGWMRPSVLESLVLVIYALMIGMLLGVVSGILVGVGRRLLGPDFLPDPDDDSAGDTVAPLLRTAFPFGPALAASALLVVLASGSLVDGPGLL